MFPIRMFVGKMGVSRTLIRKMGFGRTLIGKMGMMNGLRYFRSIPQGMICRTRFT